MRNSPICRTFLLYITYIISLLNQKKQYESSGHLVFPTFVMHLALLTLLRVASIVMRAANDAASIVTPRGLRSDSVYILS